MTDNELRFYYINMKLKHNTWRIMQMRSVSGAYQQERLRNA